MQKWRNDIFLSKTKVPRIVSKILEENLDCGVSNN